MRENTREHASFHRVGVRVGDRILDLTTATDRLLPGRAALFRDGMLDPFLAEGELLGVLHLVGEAHDYRDQTIEKGLYTMRYGLQPINGPTPKKTLPP